MTDLTNAVVLVTGANGGLGGEFVRQALERGAARVYASARNPREWNDPRVVPLVLDVTDAASVAAAAAATPDVTILVNNAGASGSASLLTVPLGDVRSIFETNVFGPLAVAQAVVPAIVANGGGALVDIHSALSWLARGAAYSATKAAFWSITNTLRLELVGQNVQVLGAHLGYTDTPMTAGLDVEKSDPVDIVAAIYDALEAGENEVLADETSRSVKAALSLPLAALYPELA